MSMSCGEREEWGPWRISDKETQSWGRAKRGEVSQRLDSVGRERSQGEMKRGAEPKKPREERHYLFIHSTNI